jgi:hypothetical protein
MEVQYRYVELIEVEDGYFIFNDDGWLLDQGYITCKRSNKRYTVIENKRIIRKTCIDERLKEYEHQLNVSIYYNKNFTGMKLENSEDVKIGDLFRIGDYEY